MQQIIAIIISAIATRLALKVLMFLILLVVIFFVVAMAMDLDAMKILANFFGNLKGYFV
ncbi:MAG: hypothetical protein LBG48_04730 [Rickettsiales bacterium]|jgi:hypothetical protein|nr:hypothetical protein [Rickettsiales bacterium]